MKKTLCLTGVLLSQQLIASDAITIDSIFKHNNGLRSSTTLDFITSGSGRRFSTYPALIGIDDGSVLVDSKKAALNQTFLYALNEKTDLIVSANGSFGDLQYADSNGFSNSTDTNFDSLWLGINYQFDTLFAEFIPSITVQVPLFEKSFYQNSHSDDSLKAFSAKLSLKNYSDPLVSTFYISTTQNFERKIGTKDIKYPDSYSLGLDLSLILNPKASINFNFEQRYQSVLKENARETNPSTTLPTMGLGATYSINQTNSVTISSSVGNSSSSPDSVVSLSLWHKF
ncbi:MAG: hypothetical protein WC279_10240 [Sulfurimonas sp.]|uniref:hypothetical protein n=1 Tax=Sulfurimonas sp. TaxID=2022749 RepID=UPI003563480D